MAGRRHRLGSVAGAARPDEGVPVPTFDRDQGGEDRRREARVVELDRKVFAACARSLPPSRSELGRTGEDAVIGSLVVLLLGPRDLGLDVERKRLDRAGEVIARLGEGADGRHVTLPRLNSGRTIAASMAINRLRGDQPAPSMAAASAEDGGPETFLAREECVPTQGKKVDGPPLREGDRGIADPRPDQPIRGSYGAPADRPRET